MSSELSELLEIIHNPGGTRILIQKQRKAIRLSKLATRICLWGWLLTVLSGIVVLYLGKIPTIELNTIQDFGSVYSGD